MARVTLKYIGQLVCKLYAKAKEQDFTELDVRETYPYIRSYSAKIMKAEALQLYNTEGKEMDAHYIYPYENLTIQVDDRNRNYIDLPANYVTLFKNQGIQEVMPVSEKDYDLDPMILVGQGKMSILRRLPAGSMELEWVAEVLPNQLRFKKRSGKTLVESGIKKVDLKMIVSSPEITNPDDPFPLPEEYIADVVDYAFMLFAKARGAQIAIEDVRDLREDLLNRNE
jgi:hypothetical protein